MTLADMVWPAIYVASGLLKLWYCILFTIIIEWVILQLFLKAGWAKTFLMSAIGNSISGLAGIYLMPWLMIFWHFLVDRFMPHATFDIINWVCTFILMCLGSVALEVTAVALIFKYRFKKLFLPMAVGNVLTYLLTAILMATNVIHIKL